MQEMNPLETQLQSWTPRRPSAKIARRLFGKAAPAASFARRADVWHWLTPVAACAMAMMFVVHGANRHFSRLTAPENASSFATLMFNAGSSNAQHTYVLSKTDENVEWNDWTHPLSTQVARWAGAGASLNVWNVILTNR